MKSIGNAFEVIVVFSLGLAIAPSAAAEQPESAVEQAKRYMEAGQEAFNQQNFTEAAKQFVNAYTATPYSAFLYNAGLAYEKQGDNKNAVDFYNRYLESDPEAKDYIQVELKIKQLLAAEKAAEDAPEKTAPAPSPEVSITEVGMKSLISVRTNPTDAKVRILDEAGNEVSSVVGQLAQTVEKGRYSVVATHPNYKTVTTDVSVTAGQVYVVVVEMSQGAFVGFLSVATDIPGAAVYIDDKTKGAAGETPFGNVIPTGKHTIWVEKPGYVTIEREVTIDVSDKQELDLTLERLPFGALLTKTNWKDAKIYQGERLLGTVPEKGELVSHLPAGTHTIRATAEGMKDYVVKVDIKGGQTTKMLVRFNPTPSRRSAAVSTGFAAAFLISGAVLGGFALHERKELRAERNAGTLASDDERIIRGFIWGVGADLSFGVGALIGSLSIYYFLRDPLPPSEGKLLDPVDFKENPPPGKTPATGTQAPAAPPSSGDTQTSSRPVNRLLVAPVLGPNRAGLGLSIAF